MMLTLVDSNTNGSVPLGGKFTVASNISYLINMWYMISTLSIRRADIFVAVTNAESGEHPLQNSLLC